MCLEHPFMKLVEDIRRKKCVLINIGKSHPEWKNLFQSELRILLQCFLMLSILSCPFLALPFTFLPTHLSQYGINSSIVFAIRILCKITSFGGRYFTNQTVRLLYTGDKYLSAQGGCRHMRTELDGHTESCHRRTPF